MIKERVNSMEERIAVLVENEEFADKLRTAETVEQAIELFASEGVSVTAEELNTYLADDADAALTEEALDDVSGGCVICIGIRIVKSILKRSSGGGGKGSFGGGGGGGGGR